MSFASTPAKVRPSAFWYFLVLTLWVAALVIFLLVAVKPLFDLIDAGTTEFRSGDQISITSDGLTVYTSDIGNQSPCELTSADGERIAMDDFGDDSFEFTPESGPQLQALATTPEDLPAGTYTVTCDQQSGVLAYGDRIDVGYLARRILIGFGIPAVLGLLGLALLIVLLVARHNSKARIRAARTSGTGYYPGGWPPPPTYPHQGGPAGGPPPSYQGGYAATPPADTTAEGPSQPEAPSHTEAPSPPVGSRSAEDPEQTTRRDERQDGPEPPGRDRPQ